MGPFRLKIARRDFEDLQRLLFAKLPREAGAFALAGIARHEAGTDILVRRIVPVPPECFLVQNEARLEIAPRAVNGLAALCEENQLGAVLCHSHPVDSPYSPSDDHGERRVFGTLRAFMPADAPTASLLLAPAGVRSRVWLPGVEEPVGVEECIVLGRHINRIELDPSAARDNGTIEPIYDRQVCAFGAVGQALISRIKVGIIGVGGTGSPSAEQLARLGVRDLVLVDPDGFDGSNVTRVYGTFCRDFGRRWWRFWRKPYKADLVARHLTRIQPRMRICVVPRNVVESSVAETLLDRDVLFLCTDDHWGRSIVNQIAYQYLIPAINVGTSIRSDNGRISHVVGVIDVLRPDMPCLWCKQFLNADRIAAESMPRRDREARAREGYVEGIDTPAPSVISVTTALAGMAVSVFLQFVTDFMGEAGEISRLSYTVLDGTVRRGTTQIAETCVCRQSRGFGDLRALPTIPLPPSRQRIAAGS